MSDSTAATAALTPNGHGHGDGDGNGHPSVASSSPPAVTTATPDGAHEVKTAEKNTNTSTGNKSNKNMRKASKQQQLQIYNLPAPIRTFPLPSFYPNNPLSLFHVLYAWLRQTIAPPPREPATVHKGVWSAATRSVHIVEQQAIRALWEQGFFGKGIYSRSEPNWLKREQARRGERAGHVAETFTAQRRKERNQMKWERARKEQEAIQRTRAQEAWVAPVGPMELLALPNSVVTIDVPQESSDASLDPKDDTIDSDRPTLSINVTVADGEGDLITKLPKSVRFSPKVEATTFEPLDPPSPGAGPYTNGQAALKNGGLFEPGPSADTNGKPVSSTMKSNNAKKAEPSPQASGPVDDIKDIEHLQLAPEEAFYLSFAMGVLDIIDPATGEPISPRDQFRMYREISANPRIAPSTKPSSAPASSSLSPLRPNDPFLLQYATYHHFRSLGWVVRPGIKFGVDWLLYHRGPVFSHAEFAVLVLPAYTHAWWKSEAGQRARGGPEEEARRSWHWLHCANRVQAKALKTLVLVYVDVPPPPTREADADASVAGVLGGYKIREFMVKRWLSNRNRD